MTSQNLESLVKTNKLKKEPGDQKEFNGLLKYARACLVDAQKESLSTESRFALGYNASHALALSGLRWHGYRCDNRYLVFQCLPHTLGVGPEIWRVLAKCHEQRNLTEYHGHSEINERLLSDLLRAGNVLLEKVAALGPVS